MKEPDYIYKRTKISNAIFRRLHKKIITNPNGDSFKETNLMKRDIIYQIATVYSENKDHRDRLFSYLDKRWFWPSTPILANVPQEGKKYYGSTISCFLLEINNSNYAKMIYNIATLTKLGGGLGILLDIPSISEEGDETQNLGFISYVKSISLVMKANSGKARSNGAVAIYMKDDHLDILQFIEMRKNKHGTDPDMFIPSYVHHGIIISDAFMEALKKNKSWALKDSKGVVRKTICPRDLLLKIVNVRVETGEPYILFEGNANKNKPDIYKILGLKIKTSNLCTEIVEPTGLDHLGNNRIAICCLGSVNLAKHDEWKDNYEQFLEDIVRMYDNIITFFIIFTTELKVGDIFPHKIFPGWLKGYKSKEKTIVEHAKKYNLPMADGIYEAYRSRNLGLGICGLTSFLAGKNLLYESKEALDFVDNIFNKMKSVYDKVNKKLAKELGACPDALDAWKKIQEDKNLNQEEKKQWKDKLFKRSVYITSIAPTSTLAVHCNTSRGPELSPGRYYVRKNHEGSNILINPYLEEKLIKNKIFKENNQVDAIRERDKNIFTQRDWELSKTAYEIPQSATVKLMGVIQKYIDQAISINLFYPIAKTSQKQIIKDIIAAWKGECKTLYYCFGQAISKQENWKEKVMENDSISDGIIDDGSKECKYCE